MIEVQKSAESQEALQPSWPKHLPPVIWEELTSETAPGSTCSTCYVTILIFHEKPGVFATSNDVFVL